MIDSAIKCGCCGDDTPEDTAKPDSDLKVSVCPECYTNLKWAQAYMKKEGIVKPE